MARVIGIDIGNQGAVALLVDGSLFAALDLPTLPDGSSCRPSISAALFADAVRELAPDQAFIEFVGPRPSDGSKSAFAFGAAKATVDAVLATLSVPVAYLTPPAWKRIVGIPAGAGTKDVARAAAVRRWPAQAALFARKSDDGRAEAALIAVAGIMRDAAQNSVAAITDNQSRRTA